MGEWVRRSRGWSAEVVINKHMELILQVEDLSIEPDSMSALCLGRTKQDCWQGELLLELKEGHCPQYEFYNGGGVVLYTTQSNNAETCKNRLIRKARFIFNTCLAGMPTRKEINR